jgi:hypothetical protein
MGEYSNIADASVATLAELRERHESLSAEAGQDDSVET